MRNSILSVLVLCVLSAELARAQQQDVGPKVGDFAPDFEAKEWILDVGAEPPSLIELRGLVVVCVFWVSFHDGAKFVLPAVNMYSNNPGIGTTGGIVTIGLTDADRRTTEPLVKLNKVFFPVGTGSKTAEQYGFQNGWGVVVIDTEGKIAFKGQPQDMNGWLNQIVELLRKQPPTRTHPAEARLAVAQLDKARKLLGEQRYGEAAKEAIEALDRSVHGDKLKAEAMSLIDLMNLIGFERMRQIDALMDAEKYKEAVDIVRFVERRFRGLDVSRDAKRRGEQLKKDNDKFKLEYDQYGDEKQAWDLLSAARKDIKERRVGEAWEKLNKVVTSYPNTESAELAQQTIGRMKAIPAVWGMVVDFQSKGAVELLAKARSLKAAGRNTEAKQLFREIMEKYAASSYADEAKDEIAKLP